MCSEDYAVSFLWKKGGISYQQRISPSRQYGLIREVEEDIGNYGERHLRSWKQSRQQVVVGEDPPR
jgi:hypothetical protein